MIHLHNLVVEIVAAAAKEVAIVIIIVVVQGNIDILLENYQ